MTKWVTHRRIGVQKGTAEMQPAPTAQPYRQAPPQYRQQVSIRLPPTPVVKTIGPPSACLTCMA